MSYGVILKKETVVFFINHPTLSNSIYYKQFAFYLYLSSASAVASPLNFFFLKVIPLFLDLLH